MSFTFGKEEFIKYRRIIRKEGTGLYTSELDENGMPHTTLPIEERWSARFFELDKVFKYVNIEGANTLEVPWYYNVSNWDGLCVFLGSEDNKKLDKPSNMRYHELNLIGIDNEK